MNPYDPPHSNSPKQDVGVKPKVRTNLRALLIPTFVGALVGSIVLAPITRGPGDPTGHGIAFGLGGLLSLIGAIVFRSVRRSNTPVSESKNIID